MTQPQTNQARVITTNQQGVHEKLDELVVRYQRSTSRRPVSAHTQAAFDDVSEWLGNFSGDIILDACCGVGESTAKLAARFPDARVIGVDKSEHRLAKHTHYSAPENNYRVIRADLNDFWRLVNQAEWQVAAHYLLYPNPYPKSTQVQKRWHASPAMPDIMAITPNIEVRSNWLTYLAEFAQAAAHYGLKGDINEVTHTEAFTPFERKYQASGQACWQLSLQSDESE